MKRILFIIGLVVLAFLLVALVILPEYRLRVGIVTIAYFVMLGFILRMTMGQYFKNAYGVLFCRRTRFVLLWSIPFFIALLVAFFMLWSGFMSGLKIDLSKDRLLSLSSETKKYLSKLDTDVTMIYIRPITGDDERNLFNSIGNEFGTYSDKIRYRSIHPVINSTDYNEIKKRLPTLSPGSAVVVSSGRVAVADKIDESDLVSAIYRARAGEQGVCVSKGHGEPELEDFGEKGAAILSSILKDRGITAYSVPVDKIDYCKVFIIFEPASDLSADEVERIKAYKGYLIVFAGAELASVQNILAARGFSTLDKISADFSKGALREYDGGIMVDKFADHPVVSTLKGSVVIESAYELKCTKCNIFAGVSLPGKTTKYVFGGSEKLEVFSGKGLVDNFFMRFKGNAELVLNMLSVALWPDYPLSQTMIKAVPTQFFAISPKYLQIIFVVSVIVFPLIILLLSVYCFRRNRDWS
ncbi:MAG: Gldg family protein [bacterium]